MTATEQLQDRYAAAMMLNYGLPPIALARGEGCVVWDVDGRSYLDLVAGIAVSALGHAHPAIVAAVTEQERLAAIDHQPLGGGLGDVLQLLGQDKGLFEDESLERGQEIEIGREHGCVILELESYRRLGL